MTTMEKGQIKDVDGFNAFLASRFDGLSKQLKKIARFVLDNPIDTALDTAAEIAGKIEVQPSSLIRFAQALGFDGFSEIQRIFREGLVQQLPGYSANYSHRIEKLKEGAEDTPTSDHPVLNVFIDANIDAINALRQDATEAKLNEAVSYINGARHVYVVGQRRSYPVAIYLYYMMRNLDVPTYLLDGVGGLLPEQANQIGPEDTVIVVTFPNYSDQVINLAHKAAENGARIVGLTDRLVSPIVKLSDVYFLSDKLEVSGFRTVAGTMCLAQTLMIALGLDRETDGKDN